jgi:hypothetical protein
MSGSDRGCDPDQLESIGGTCGSTWNTAMTRRDILELYTVCPSFVDMFRKP